MKKKFSVILALVLCAFAGVLFSACGEATLESIYIRQGSIATVVQQGDTVDLSNIVVIAKMSDKTEKLVDNSECTFSSIDTQVLGEQVLVVTYDGKEAKVTIKVVKKLNNYTIMGFEDSAPIKAYKNDIKLNTYNKTGMTNAVKGFTDVQNEYIVGSDNEFVYQPVLLVHFAGTGISETFNLKEFEADIKVSILDVSKTTPEYVELTGENLAEYVSFDATTHKFQFTTKANGNKFKIELLPANMTEDEEAIISPSVHEFRVKAGWNAYTAKDITYIDNANMKDKWNELKSAKDFEISNNITSIIMHNDISIKDSDLPSIHFLTADDIEEGANDYDRAVGSLKDSDTYALGHIIRRELNSGETFTLEGNYFQLSAQDISLIVRKTVEEKKDGATQIIYKELLENEALTVHTTLFGFYGKTSNQEKANYALNNVSLIGNTKKSDNAYMSGGIMFCKTHFANFTAYNNLSQCWFVSYMSEGNSAYDDTNVVTFNKVNAFDAYNTMLYFYGSRNVNIENSVMIGAGGPIMICDHVGNNATTGEGGFITNVKTNNSVLESFVAGSEGWFATYNASALATQIKAFNPLFVKMGKTLCDSKGEKLNLVAVYKSSSNEGTTNSTIRGSFVVDDKTSSLQLTNDQKFLDFAYSTGLAVQVKTNVYNQLKDGALSQGMTEEQATAYADANVYEQTMAYLNSDDGASAKAQLIAGAKQFASNGMFMETDSGAVAFPGQDGNWYQDSSYNFDGTPDQAKLDASDKYIFVYLPLGMATVLGIY